MSQSAKRAYTLYVLGILCAVNIFNSMDRYAISVLIPLIKDDLRLSDTEIGFATGTAFAFTYVLCGLPVARLADTRSRRNIVALSLASWSVMAALTGAVQNALHLTLTRMGLGAGESGAVPAINSLISDYFERRLRPLAYSVSTFALVFGSSLGLGVAGVMADTIGWRWTFVAFGLPGILLALLIWGTVREPLRGALDDAEPTDKVLLRDAVKILFSRRVYVLLLFVTVLNSVWATAIGAWLPSFLRRSYGISVSEAGQYLSVAGVVSGLTMIAGGYAATRLGEKREHLTLIIAAAGTFLLCPFTLASLMADSAEASAILWTIGFLFYSVAAGPTIAILYSEAPPSMRATGGIIVSAASMLTGQGLGPLLAGAISDSWTALTGSDGLQVALSSLVGLVPLSSVLLLFAARELAKRTPASSSEKDPAPVG